LEAFGLRLDSAGSTLTAEMVMTTRVILGEIERNSPRLALAETHLSWSRLVAEKLVELLAGTDLIQLPEASGGGKAQRHVRVALEFMHAHYADIISMADVAAACGISIRSLEYAFKSVWGTSPQAALTMIRLDEARSILSKPNEARSVTQAALACGFGHVGRFAAAYRSKFGETPSRTLSRA
jgi:transcriptional regulator GlxA family with amidase domain